ERGRRGTRWHLDPAEQRPPVLVCTSGGNRAQCFDIGRHVTRTFEGSGASATRTRRTVPRAGATDRYASPGTSLSPPAFRCGGGGHCQVVEDDRLTVCFGATAVVVGSYGCDDGRIAPTRCAVLGAGHGARERHC